MKVIIVGGGSAGWMTATTLLTAKPEWDISLIESKNIPTIGVGESTLETINNWCHYVGLDEEKFLKETDGSYKLSIKFTDFYKKGESFHYPFGEADLWNNFHGINDWWFKKFLYPNTPNSDYAECIFPKQMAYVNGNKFDRKDCATAYHFNAIKFAKWLKENKCKKIKHIVDDIHTIEQNENGIKSLNNKYEADLFIDCTGFKSLLIDKTLKEPFISYKHILKNDSAWAVQIPYEDKKKQLVTYTNCTAIENGWVWRAPLWSRIGTGYVYSSEYVSDEQALKEFKNHLINNEKVKDVEKLEFRNIKSRIGIHNRLWVKNVVAIGLSAGFIEPLESNGLYTVHQFLMNFIRNIRRNKFSQWDRDNFNFMCKVDYHTFAEFVALHYSLSHRTDTKYWQDNFNREWDKNFIDIKPRYLGNFRLLVENRTFDYTYSHTGGTHCIAAGMNFAPTDLDIIKYNVKDNFTNLKITWLNAIKNLNRKKEKAELAVYHKPSLYKYLKENIYEK